MEYILVWYMDSKLEYSYDAIYGIDIGLDIEYIVWYMDIYITTRERGVLSTILVV